MLLVERLERLWSTERIAAQIGRVECLSLAESRASFDESLVEPPAPPTAMEVLEKRIRGVA